jgi:hypothetical protein
VRVCSNPCKKIEEKEEKWGCRDLNPDQPVSSLISRSSPRYFGSALHASGASDNSQVIRHPLHNLEKKV